jgi:hypothetical protein
MQTELDVILERARERNRAGGKGGRGIGGGRAGVFTLILARLRPCHSDCAG